MMMIRIGACLGLAVVAQGLNSKELYMQVMRAPHVEGFHEENSFVPTEWAEEYKEEKANGRPPALPPAPFPAGVWFSGVFSNYTVLQRAPAKSAVYGVTSEPSTKVILTVVDESTKASSTPTVVTDPKTGYWKAYIPANEAGGNFTLTVGASGLNSTTIHSVTFGDVFVCSGQSNMQLSLVHTFDRNLTLRRIREEGKYLNIRTMQIQDAPKPDGQETWILPPRPAAILPDECGGGSCAYTWATPDTMVPVFDKKTKEVKSHVPVLDSFSGACWYFAMELTDILYSGNTTTPVPIGLIETAVGGTQIEGWLSNATLKASCTNQTGGKPDISWAGGNGALYNGMILPLVNMSIKGAMWYQGENNCAECARGCSKAPTASSPAGPNPAVAEDKCGPDTCGNVEKKTGYPCYLKAMINEWRQVWSVEPGTTDALFPFGVYTLASTEGGCGDGAFRQSQTLNFGVLPSPDMPNTFVAQGFDAQDPVSISGWPQGERDNRAFGYDSPYSMGGGDNNYAVDYTPFFMGPIHPRPKHIIGRRMAQAAAAHIYNDDKIAWTGPIIKNCSVGAKGVTIYFNTTLLRSDAVAVFPPVNNHPQYGPFELHTAEKAKLCAALPGNVSHPLCSNFGGTTPMEVEYSITLENGTRVSTWLPVGIKTQSGPFINTDCKPNKKNPNAPVCVNGTMMSKYDNIQTHPLLPNGKLQQFKVNFTEVITGIRYAWSASPCCPDSDRSGAPCPPNSCPIRSYNSTLPAAPFYAKIVNGKCECTAPQICS